MISAGDFRKGTTFEMDGDVYQIIDFQHVKPGKGAAFVRTKIKSVKNGGSREMTFNPNDKYEVAKIETKEMQYLYSDGELYYFMDTETYEQLPLNFDVVEEALLYLRENDNATIRFHDGKAFQVNAPNFVELEVVETEPGVKGDTAQGATKAATVETGYTLQVPLFVKEGDVLVINTSEGTYVSRA